MASLARDRTANSWMNGVHHCRTYVLLAAPQISSGNISRKDREQFPVPAYCRMKFYFVHCLSTHSSRNELRVTTLFARIENVFDEDYETFGLLSEPEEVFPDFEDPRFLGAGPPFGAWLGAG